MPRIKVSHLPSYLPAAAAATCMCHYNRPHTFLLTRAHLCVHTERSMLPCMAQNINHKKAWGSPTNVESLLPTPLKTYAAPRFRYGYGFYEAKIRTQPAQVVRANGNTASAPAPTQFHGSFWLQVRCVCYTCGGCDVSVQAFFCARAVHIGTHRTRAHASIQTTLVYRTAAHVLT